MGPNRQNPRGGGDEDRDGPRGGRARALWGTDDADEDQDADEQTQRRRFLTVDLVRKYAGVEPGGSLARVRTLNLHLPRGSGKLREIENLDALEQLEELDLSFNEIRVARNLGALTRLRVLNLAENRICKLDACFEWLSCLENLNLSGNLLEGIPHVVGKLEALRTLRLARNRIRRATDLERLEPLRRLCSLTIVGNPCAADAVTKDLAIFTVKSLDVLDGEAVKIAQRDAARARFERSEVDNLRAAVHEARADAARLADQKRQAETQLLQARAGEEDARLAAQEAAREGAELRSELDAKRQMLDHKAVFASDVANELSDIKQQLLFARIEGSPSKRPAPLALMAPVSPSPLPGDWTATSPRMVGILRRLKERIRSMQEEELSLSARVERLCKARAASQEVLESAQTELASVRALLLRCPQAQSLSPFSPASAPPLRSPPQSPRPSGHDGRVSLADLEAAAAAHQSAARSLEAQLLAFQDHLHHHDESRGPHKPAKSRTPPDLGRDQLIDKVALTGVAFGQEQVRYAQAVERLARACLRRQGDAAALQRARQKLQSAKDHLRRAVAAQRESIGNLGRLLAQHRAACENMLARRADLALELEDIRDSPELDASFAPAVDKILGTISKARGLREVASRVGAQEPAPEKSQTTVAQRLVTVDASPLPWPSPAGDASEEKASFDAEAQSPDAHLRAQLTRKQHQHKAETSDWEKRLAKVQRDLDEAREREKRALDRAQACEDRVAELETALQTNTDASKAAEDRAESELGAGRNAIVEQTKRADDAHAACARMRDELTETCTKLETERASVADLHAKLEQATQASESALIQHREQAALSTGLCAVMAALARGLEVECDAPNAETTDFAALAESALDNIALDAQAGEVVHNFLASVQTCTAQLGRACAEKRNVEAGLAGALEKQRRYERIQEALPLVREELSAAETRAKEAASTASREEERLRSLASQVEEMQSRAAELRAKIAEARTTFADTDAQASAAASQSRTLTRQVESLRSQKASLELQLATLEETCAGARAEQARITADARKEEDRANDLRKQCRAQEARLDVLRREREDVAKEIERLAAQNADASKANTEAASTQRDLIREVADQERARDRLNAQVQDLTQKVRELSRRQEASQWAADEAEERRTRAANDLADLQRQTRELPEIMQVHEARKALADIEVKRAAQERRLQVLELYQLTEAADGGTAGGTGVSREAGEAAHVLESLKQVYVEGLRQVQDAFSHKEQRLKQALRHAREELVLARRKHEEQLVAVNDALASDGHRQLLEVAQDLQESAARLAAQRDVDFRAQDAQTALAEKDAKLLFLSGQVDALKKEMRVREGDLCERNARLQAMLEKALERVTMPSDGVEDGIVDAEQMTGRSSPRRQRALSVPRPAVEAISPAYIARSPEESQAPASGAEPANLSMPEMREQPSAGDRAALSKYTRVRARRAHIHMQEDGRVGIDLVQSQRSAALTLPVHLAPNVSLHTMVYGPDRQKELLQQETMPQLETKAFQSPLTAKVRELRLELEAMKHKRF